MESDNYFQYYKFIPNTFQEVLQSKISFQLTNFSYQIKQIHNCVTQQSMSFFGVQLNSQVNRLILQIKLKLSQNKLGPNFRTIYRSLAQHDPNITGLIKSSLFQKSLNQNGFFFKKFQIQAFQKGFLGQNGLINWFGFLQKLRQPMGPLRRQIVEGIFDEISKGKNQIAIEQLYQNFNTEGCDSFKKVVKDQKANFNNFISLLHINNDKLSKEEFVSYYNDINTNFPEDQTFVRYICNQWRCQPRTIQKFNQQQIKTAIKNLRFKLIQKTNGTKDQFLLQKVFFQFDQNKSGAIGTYQLDLMLKKLELPTPSKLISPLLQSLDKNKSGYIQYEQFKRFLFFDPFLK